jgi:type I restriction enzyme S subunit
MIAESQMKDSGIDWIEEIPRDWNKKRLKHIGNFYSGLTGKSGEDFRSENNPKNKQFITFSNILNNTIISKNNFGNVVIDKNERQNKVEKNDIFFLMSSESYEDIGKSSLIAHEVGELYLNSFCKGYRLKTQSINPKFLNFQLMGSLHRSFIKVEGNGFTRINLRLEKVKDIPVFTPPLEEQKRISDYLNKKTQQIDELVKKTEKKIELLKEQRTALINHCVTKGLNPDAEMKDSGIEWIGEVPKQWELKKLKYLSKINNGATPKSGIEEYWNGDISWFAPSDFNNLDNHGYLSISQRKISSLGLDSCGCTLIETPSLLLTTRAPVGNICKIENEFSFNQGCKSITPGENSNLNYIFYFLIVSTDELNSLSNGTTFKELPTRNLINYFITFPPLEEQKEIADYLDQKTQQIDKLVEKEEKRISLLKEYRQSLISSAVTGKIRITEDML